MPEPSSLISTPCFANGLIMVKALFQAAFAVMAPGGWSNLPAKMELVLKRLIFLGAPKELWQQKAWSLDACYTCSTVPPVLEAFIEILVLLLHLQMFIDSAPPAEYEVVEMFAGQARVAKLAKSLLGISACALDKSYCDNHAMDINSSAGFLRLVSTFAREPWIESPVCVGHEVALRRGVTCKDSGYNWSSGNLLFYLCGCQSGHV